MNIGNPGASAPGTQAQSAKTEQAAQNTPEQTQDAEAQKKLDPEDLKKWNLALTPKGQPGVPEEEGKKSGISISTTAGTGTDADTIDTDAESEAELMASQMQNSSQSVNDLFSRQVTNITAGGTSNAQQVTEQQPLANKLVSQILASPPEAGKAEVRLTISPDLLPDTEIRLTRSNDGMLSVSLISDNQTSRQTLVAEQHNLRTLLQTSEPDVRVEVKTSTDAESGDSRRESRGQYFQQDDEKK